jgi:HAD superfamily phosphatase (TIGR01668 family)
MLQFLRPNQYLASVLELGPARLRSLRLEGLLLDLDGTLKNHDATEIDPPVARWVRTLRDAGIGLCLLSNGRAKRVGRLAQGLAIPFIAGAFKPLPGGCLAGVAKLGLPPGRCAVVGDQLFADVLAGRLAGLYTFLVRPTSPVEPWFTRVKRPFERQALRWMKVPGLNPGGPAEAVCGAATSLRPSPAPTGAETSAMTGGHS